MADVNDCQRCKAEPRAGKNKLGRKCLAAAKKAERDRKRGETKGAGGGTDRQIGETNAASGETEGPGGETGDAANEAGGVVVPEGRGAGEPRGVRRRGGGGGMGRGQGGRVAGGRDPVPVGLRRGIDARRGDRGGGGVPEGGRGDVLSGGLTGETLWARRERARGKQEGPRRRCSRHAKLVPGECQERKCREEAGLA